MVRAVSFDFHDTVAICPRWFQLETRHLVSTVHQLLVAADCLPPGPPAAELDAAYRQLRLEIHEHGREHDATACVVEVFQRLGLDCPQAPIAAAVEAAQRATFADCRPRPGSVEAIQRLAAGGLPVGITSNAVYHPFLDWSLDRFGLRSALTSVISSASCGYYKRRPEIFQQTAAALGVPLTDLVHIGDSFRFDVLAASRLGIRTVWLNLTGAPAPQEGVADLIVADLDGLADLLPRHDW